MNRVLLLLFVTGQTSQAFSKFRPECSKPEESVNFVAVPATRGSLTILWSCFFTIIICTWSIHHLNVPEQREGRDPGEWGDFKWARKTFNLKLRWMLITVVAPECILLKALERRYSAKLLNYSLMAFAERDRVPWSLSHTHFAHMGGFVIRHSIPDPVPEPFSHVHGEPYLPPKPNSDELDISEQGANVADLASTAVPEKDISTQVACYSWLPNPFHLHPYSLIVLSGHELLRLPNVQKEDLMDRSKSDNFTKAVALFQIFVNILDVITRGVQGLPVSQLEISVIAFAICAVLIHVAQWDCPQDVGTAITSAKYQGQIPDKVLETMRDEMEFFYKAGNPIPNQLLADPRGPALLLGLLGNTIFTAIHILAWSFTFPSTMEAILWRLASAICTGTCAWWFLLFGFHSLWRCHSGKDIKWVGRTGNPLGKIMQCFAYPAAAVYVVARLFLVVESFRPLAYLPPDAYVATWAASFPGFG